MATTKRKRAVRRRAGERRTVGRSGRPLRTESIFMRVEPDEKRSIEAAARRRGLSITGYLVWAHRSAGEVSRG